MQEVKNNCPLSIVHCPLIVVLGGGESGIGSAILAQKQGCEVFVSDSGQLKAQYRQMLVDNRIAYEEGGHSADRILQATEIIKSPGIPDTAALVQDAARRGIPVISEIEFAARYTNAKMICVTGSNGKTTTASLIHFMLKNAGINVGLGGNVGQSFALQVATEKFDVYVLELSSFQLDGMYKFRADIAVLLNITPDHLDRYAYKMENYVRSKFRIVQNMTADDTFIYCADDPVITQYIGEYDIKAQMLPFSFNQLSDHINHSNNAFINNNNLTAMYKNETFEQSLQDLSLKGKHNQYNSMAATLAGMAMNIQKKHIRESLRRFQSVEHRLEKVMTVRGITFINDSKATNVNSTWYALDSFSAPIIWIVGGTDKGNDYSTLTDIVRQKVKVIVCLVKDNTKIQAAFASVVETIVETQSAAAAVQAAYHFGSKGDVVLLSPACASFDLFQNYEDRGRQFKEAVRNL
jgi:UDP-N-acetylmuramoylalanine--D-glutamate ligase